MFGGGGGGVWAERSTSGVSSVMGGGSKSAPVAIGPDETS